MEFFPPDSFVREPLRLGAGPRVCSPQGTVALRSALQSLVRTGAAPAEVRRLVNVFCGAARRAGLYPEQLLIALKTAWHSLPEVRRQPRGGRDELLDKLISACIREFYAPQPAPQDVPTRVHGGPTRAD
jgi:hypothetical protein